MRPTVRRLVAAALLCFWLSAGLGLVFGTVSASAADIRHRPNIVLILADDLGWPDVSTYGRSTVRTPNIDRIAKAGVAFTNGYVAASVCAVSRAALLTGRAPARFGFTYSLDDRLNLHDGLPLAQKTMANYLKAFGYHTGIIGKWHLGTAPPYYPTKRGFDEFFGFLGGETWYVDPNAPGMVTTRTRVGSYALKTRPKTGEIVEGPDAHRVDDFSKYLTSEITEKAIDYIDRNSHQKSPFFLYLAYSAPHWPLQVPQSYYDKFSKISDPVRRTYVAMIAALDDGIGAVLKELAKTGVRKNTIVIFLSDNGCPMQFGFCDCSHPLGAGKFTYLEGGTRVPFMMSWPAHLRPHAPIDAPVSSLDILPTLLHAVAPKAARPTDLDGVDLMGIIEHPSRNHLLRTLYWGQDPIFAIREGKWKLWKSEDEHLVKLYDLDADPSESKDVSTEHQKVFDKLEHELLNWQKTLMPPLWPRRYAGPSEVCGRVTEQVY